MPSKSKTDNRIRGLLGSGLASWILLTIAVFAPEWTRQDNKHCGIIFCCLSLYGNCTVTHEEIVSHSFSYIFASWLLSVVAIFSSTCRCSEMKIENVRQMAVLLVVSGVLALTGSTEFFIHKFTNDDLNFSACGFVAHAAGWILLISGCCGYCYGYSYSDIRSESFDFQHRMQMSSFGGLQNFSRYGPMNFARIKWREMQNKTSPLTVTP